MKRQPALFFVFLFAVIGIALLLAGWSANPTAQSPVERGKYLVMAGGCNDCHSPKVFSGTGPALDTGRLLSGYPSGAKLPEIPKGLVGPTQWGAFTTNDMTAWVGSWGVSFASNLTPDPATGIGDWPDSLFLRTLRTGKFMGTSRNILPPMPWQDIGQLTDSDLKAIFAYLKSLRAIANAVPPPLPPG